MSKKNDLIDISIRIGNSHDWEKISPGKTYNFRVYRNTIIKELKSIFSDLYIKAVTIFCMNYNDK